MKTSYIILTCDICGGEGLGTLMNGAAALTGEELRHNDPAICAENLERKQRDLIKKEKDLKEKYGDV
jgi:hypothetical protein